MAEKQPRPFANPTRPFKSNKAQEDGRTITGGLMDRGRIRREQLTQALSSAPRRPTRNDLTPMMELVTIPIADLKMPAKEIRKLTEGHITEVSNGITTMGFCVPALVGKNNEVLDGVVRVKAAEKLGLGSIPCVKIDHLTPAEQRVLRIAVNRMAEKGEWDLEGLKMEFEELIILDAPLEATGFSSDQIDQIVIGNDLDLTEEGTLEPEGAIATSRLGDIYKLGAHRLICGSATEAATYDKLMAGDPPARFVFTDEPYNVPIKGHVSKTHGEFVMASGEMTDVEFLDFNKAWMSAALPTSARAASWAPISTGAA